MRQLAVTHRTFFLTHDTQLPTDSTPEWASNSAVAAWFPSPMMGSRRVFWAFAVHRLEDLLFAFGDEPFAFGARKSSWSSSSGVWWYASESLIGTGWIFPERFAALGVTSLSNAKGVCRSLFTDTE